MLKDISIIEGFSEKISTKCNLCDREGNFFFLNILIFEKIITLIGDHFEEMCNIVKYHPKKYSIIFKYNHHTEY